MQQVRGDALTGTYGKVYSMNLKPHHFDRVWFKDGVEVKVEHTFGRGGAAYHRRPHPFDKFGYDSLEEESDIESEAEGCEVADEEREAGAEA